MSGSRHVTRGMGSRHVRRGVGFLQLYVLLRVSRGNVPIQRPLLGRLVVTELARERPLPRVTPHVHFVLVRPVQAAGAKAALKLPRRRLEGASAWDRFLQPLRRQGGLWRWKHPCVRHASSIFNILSIYFYKSSKRVYCIALWYSKLR